MYHNTLPGKNMFGNKMRVCLKTCLWFLILGSTSVFAWQPGVVGEVYEEQTQKLLYREIYRVDDAGVFSRVEYQLPDGTLLAEKDVQPMEQGLLSFQQTNHFLRRRQAVGFASTPFAPIPIEGASEPIRLRLQFESERKQIDRLVTTDPGKGIVIDAGFDEFIRHHWTTLLEGASLSIQFPMASRGKLFDMVVAQEECLTATEDSVCFAVDLDSTLFNLLVPDPIHLVYHRDTRRLQRYRGLGNVAMADGRIPRIDIVYQYPSDSRDSPEH